MEGISKSFPGVKALDKCRISLNKGEVHALVGENGAGKSTLMKILTGVYTKDEGRILIDGKEAVINNPRDAQKYGISIIHQELNLMPHLTVAQNIFIGRESFQKNRILLNDKELNRKTEELLKLFNLDIKPTVKVSELTVAKRQMIEIIKAISYNSRILIMDEPTAALSETEVEELFRTIRRLKNDGVGIIYISHRLAELKQIADRVTVMRDGKYIDTVNIDDVTVDDIVKMMVGRNIFVSAPEVNASDDAPIALEVRGISRGKLVKNVSFKLKQGEILGIAGLMGAGRTETARAIFGADPRDAGEIYVNGKLVDIKTPTDAVNAGIAYLSEDRKQFGLALGLDVETNIALAYFKKFTKLFGFVDTKKTSENAEEMVRKLQIKTPSVKQKVKNLSGGNQQKVVLGKWLTRNCNILIFDEPTRGIDVGAKSEVYSLLNDLAKQGKAIIVISSELPEIIRISHRVLVMCEGRITGEVSGDEITQENIMTLATKHID
ncbi:MAG TPA: sugar ABC transporter ATP-binding protein [Clostridiaceae bacterium]|nr:sugar ABC transporter ATP-binding protein [Clostridiaceae bacterium]